MSGKDTKKQSVSVLSPRPEDTRASLCIYKEDLDPDEISKLLDLEPSVAQKKGGLKVHVKEGCDDRTAKVGGWFLSTNSKVKGLDPELHIQWLVDKITHRHSVLRKLQQDGYKIEIWVYWLSSSSNASPSLSPDLMRRLANLRIPIVFDIYF